MTEENCFQLKADFFAFTVMKLKNYHADSFLSQLKHTTESAPNYFKNTPVILDVKDCLHDYDLENLCRLLREQGILPIGIRGLPKQAHDTALKQGLAIMATSAKIAPENPPSAQGSQTKSDTKSKIITKPVRAGTRVYAKEGDLVILSSVNPGGECIADGNIHVYGPLRGRALAGASGNREARIFCSQLDAELVSIAGHYRINETIEPLSSPTGMMQIYLENNKLMIKSLSPS